MQQFKPQHVVQFLQEAAEQDAKVQRRIKSTLGNATLSGETSHTQTPGSTLHMTTHTWKFTLLQKQKQWQSNGGHPHPPPPLFHHDQPLIPGKASCGKNIIDGYQNRRILLNWQLFDWNSYWWLGKNGNSYLICSSDWPTLRCRARRSVRQSFGLQEALRTFSATFPGTQLQRFRTASALRLIPYFFWFVCFAHFDADETHDWWWTHLKNKNHKQFSVVEY